MNIFLVNYLHSLSIIFAAAIGVLKWNRIDAENKPVIIAWWVIVISETLRFVLLKSGIYSTTSYNLFVLVISWLYTWQFRAWKILGTQLFWLLISLLSILWLLDYFVIDGYKLPERRFYFRIAFAFVLVILSVISINGQIMSEKRQLWRNHRFLICIGFTIYYTYRIFVDAFSVKGLSVEFLTTIGNFNRQLLHFYYFILLMAAIWIPRKKSFILP